MEPGCWRLGGGSGAPWSGEGRKGGHRGDAGTQSSSWAETGVPARAEGRTPRRAADIICGFLTALGGGEGTRRALEGGLLVQGNPRGR